MKKTSRNEIQIKRIYDGPAARDGFRVLVDRLWPRGISKESAAFALWLKEAGPSPELRKWFGHDPVKWGEFRRRFRAELESNPEAWKPLMEALQKGRITLLFAARDTDRNNAVVLKEFLDEKRQA